MHKLTSVLLSHSDTAVNLDAVDETHGLARHILPHFTVCSPLSQVQRPDRNPVSRPGASVQLFIVPVGRARPANTREQDMP